jgi:hypothetical protein
MLPLRMKRSGVRWKEQTAREVIHLRTLALSDRWTPALRLTRALAEGRARGGMIAI